MRKTEWKKPVVAALTLAMALSGVAVDGAAPASANVAVSAKLADGAATGSATDATTGTAVTPTAVPTATPGAATGSAVTPDTPAEAAKLINIMKKMDEQTQNMEEGKQMLIQKGELTSAENQNIIFAQKNLRKKSKKVKVYSYDLDQDGSPELLALYPNKKLEIYTNALEMLTNGAKIKPNAVVKKVKEVRKQGKDKLTLVIKQKKKKKTSIAKFKYGFMKLKKKGKVKAKAFKKLKKVPFESLRPGVDPLYDDTDFLYASRDQYVVNMRPENSIDVYNNTVLRYDKDDKENPYKAYGGGIDSYRYVFGADAEKDWKSLVAQMTSLREFCAPIKIAAKNSKDFRVAVGPEQKDKNYTAYDLIPNDEDGSEADFFYRLIVDEKASHLVSIEEWMSVGLVKERYDFYFGDAANYDGQMYDPGNVYEAYADPDYVKQTDLKTRTLTVNYAGTKKEVKTAYDSAFYLWSTTGKFSATVDGKEIPDLLALEPGTHEAYMAYEMVNPSSGDVGYLEPTGENTWKPNLQ